MSYLKSGVPNLVPKFDSLLFLSLTTSINSARYIDVKVGHSKLLKIVMISSTKVSQADGEKMFV